MIVYFNVCSKLDGCQLNLPHRAKKPKRNNERTKSKNGYAQKKRYPLPGRTDNTHLFASMSSQSSFYLNIVFPAQTSAYSIQNELQISLCTLYVIQSPSLLRHIVDLQCAAVKNDVILQLV